MSSELHADGIGEITVTGAVVRIDLMSLAVIERDGQNNPKPAFRQRILMPVEAGAVRRLSDVRKIPRIVPPQAG
jgi:hypothetical protein